MTSAYGLVRKIDDKVAALGWKILDKGSYLIVDRRGKHYTSTHIQFHTLEDLYSFLCGYEHGIAERPAPAKPKKGKK